jgi:hypothetical protein
MTMTEHAHVQHLVREFVTHVSQHASVEERTLYPMIRAKVAEDDGSKVRGLVRGYLCSWLLWVPTVHIRGVLHPDCLERHTPAQCLASLHAVR